MQGRSDLELEEREESNPSLSFNAIPLNEFPGEQGIGNSHRDIQLQLPDDRGKGKGRADNKLVGRTWYLINSYEL